jgi:hypothetical protein
MPPKKTRSTGALRIALITSSGVAAAAVKPSAARASGESATSFKARENTPPPLEMSARS